MGYHGVVIRFGEGWSLNSMMEAAIISSATGGVSNNELSFC
jgi:hypothetical protein